MEEKYLVSIIIPVYNGEKYIEKTILSCLNQSYKNIEIIIIDDSSNDKSFYNLLKIKNKKITLLRNNTNKGVIRTVNLGIAKSKGDKIIIVGQDDILLENHIETMLKFFDDNTSFIYCASDYINSNDEVFFKGKTIKRVDNLKKNIFIKNQINSCGLIFSRKKAIEVGLFEYNKLYPNFGEWLFWLKLCSVGEVQFCDSIKSYYRRHENNMTNSFQERKIKKILRSYFLECMRYSKKNFYSEFNFLEKIKYYIFFIKVYFNL